METSVLMLGVWNCKGVSKWGKDERGDGFQYG